MRISDWSSDVCSSDLDVYMPMIGTAEVVAKRYGIARDRQDAYALQSQQRTAAAQQAGRFDDEIIPVTATMLAKDKATGDTSKHEVRATKDEGNRPDRSEARRVGEACQYA